MTRISRYKLKEDRLTKLYDLLFEVINQSVAKKEFLEIFSEILSPTEKIMIAKRIAMIFLIIKGVDQRTIGTTLKMSTGTVCYYNIFFQNKNSKLVDLIKTMLTKKKIIEFLDDIFVGLFVHPGIYKGHWAVYWSHKKSKQEVL